MSEHFVHGWKRPTPVEEAFAKAMASNDPRSSKAPDWNFDPVIESHDVKWHRIYNERLRNAALQRAALHKKKKALSLRAKKYLSIIQRQQQGR